MKCEITQSWKAAQKILFLYKFFLKASEWMLFSGYFQMYTQKKNNCSMGKAFLIDNPNHEL